MEINLNNYEAFFLDYKEGSLSHEQESELFLFLEKHPHLYEELHGFENIVLENLGMEESFSNKNSIKKTDCTNENLIAYTEGLLDAKNKSEIELLSSQSNTFKKELEYYKSAKVQPDLNERFKNKSKLKRGGVIITLQNNYTFLRVAAAILLLAGLFFLVSKFNTKEDIKNEKTEVAEVKTNQGSKKQETRVEKQNPENEKQLAVGNQEARVKKQEPIEKVGSPKMKNEIQPNQSLVIKNIANNNTPVKENISAPVQKDSLIEKIVLANNNPPLNQNTTRSYFNYSPDKDIDEETKPVVASVVPTKKSFFQKLTKVAKNINEFGIKKVNASEENNANTLVIGGLVFSETTTVSH